MREKLELITPQQLGPFLIYHLERDPWSGPGHGVNGVSGRLLIDAYLEGLNAAFEKLSSERSAQPQLPIKVYIFHHSCPN